MKRPKSLITYALVFIISILLLLNLYLTWQNSITIDHNIEIKKKAEAIKVETTDIIRNLHLMDLGIRGYALLPNKANLGAYDSAIYHLNVTFKFLEKALGEQHFPMKDLYTFKDSVYAYVHKGELMLHHLQDGNHELFMDTYKHDYGYGTWLQYLQFYDQLESFENNIFNQANLSYKKALTQNTTFFFVLLILIIPTLFYTAYHSNRSYEISERLRLSELQKNEILSNQNITLEKLVKERTEEIETQNEEIIAQNEELSEANQIIEEQNRIIKNKNLSLKDEVDRQTNSLITANAELLQRINKMEQYAFIVSHNLRSPVAQILGLISIVKEHKLPKESEDVLNYIGKASNRLDTVLKDLNKILIIENKPEKNTTYINLKDCIYEVTQTLSEEIKQSKTKILQKLEVTHIESVSTYVYSIFFNLLSNAIKYRDPARNSEITVSSYLKNEMLNIEISDHGLGIDMEKYAKEIFNLYRRFHTHVDGKGLGLYLTKIQVESLGGVISLHSKPGAGTTFIIQLPQVKVNA